MAATDVKKPCVTICSGTGCHASRSDKVTQAFVDELAAKGLTDTYHLLTDREKEVLQLLAEGRSNKEVAAALHVTVRTVESSLTRIYEKLGVRTRAELAHRRSQA